MKAPRCRQSVARLALRTFSLGIHMTTSPVYSAEPNDQHGHTTPGSSCPPRDHDLSAVTTFHFKSSLLLPGPAINCSTPSSPLLSPPLPPSPQSLSLSPPLATVFFLSFSFCFSLFFFI